MSFMTYSDFLTFGLTTYDISRFVLSFDKARKTDPLRAYTKLHNQGATIDGLKGTDYGLALSDPETPGIFISEAFTVPEFDWLVPWVNADMTGNGSIRMDVQVEIEGVWTEWYPMWRWGSISASMPSSDEKVKIEADTLILAEKAGRYRLRCIFGSATGNGDVGSKEEIVKIGPADSVLLSRCGVITRNKSAERIVSRQYLIRESAFKVQGRSQMMEHPSIKGRICSPTSVAMALDHLGHHYPTAFVASDSYDSGALIYGNWAFNVASLWRLGACARLDFFPNFELASQELFMGRLLIASIAFKEGMLTGAPIQKTAGHLVLLTGIEKDKDGSLNVLVNDPAAPTHEEVPRKYSLTEFEKVWKGIVYVVEGRK
jgi:hypothetical protein